jgi:hypothetical protein
MLPYVVVVWNSFPPPPLISSKQVHSSSSSKSITCNLIIVKYLFLGGEVTSWRVNLSLGVGGSIRIFSQWDWCTSKGKTVVECVCFLSLKNCSLVTSLGEICCTWTTSHFWLVHDIGSSGVVILGEGTSYSFYFILMFSPIGKFNQQLGQNYRTLI